MGRKKQAKPSDREYPDGPRWSREFAVGFKVMEELKTASDRASVLVVAAIIDNALEMLLRHYFLVCSDSTQEECSFLLTRRPVPVLGSASIRARLAFLLGLIDRQFRDALLSVFDTRNNCAHQPLPQKITDDAVNGLLGKLPAKFVRLLKKSFRILGELPELDNPRGRFIAVCMGLQSILLMKADTEFGDMIPGERA